MKKMVLLAVLCAAAVLTLASVASAQSAPVVEEDGSISIAPDVGTDCRLFAFNVEQGYDLGLTQEQIQSVLAQCEQTGFLPSTPFDQSAPVVEEDGSISLASDVGTDCRSFAYSVEQGYDLGLTQEQIQSVLAQCEEVGDTEVQKVACSELGDSGEQAQQEAIALLNQDASDPNGLDADGDGIPCEFTQESGQIFYEDDSAIFDVLPNNVTLDGDTTDDQYTDEPISEQPVPTQPDPVEPAPVEPAPDQPTSEVVGVDVLPDTGGASLLVLGAGALLVAGGLLARHIKL